MCRSLAEGGARCASHTRPTYQTAPFGTPEWDEAAAAYASTPTGRMELLASKAAAEEARDVTSVVAFEHALAQGERMREKADAFREELAAYTAPAPVIEAVPAVVVPEYEPADDYFSEDYYSSYDHDDTDDEDEGTDRYDFHAWSPTMTGQRWNTGDPAFAGCTRVMTSDQFIDRVCHNLDVSRQDFETAAAEYLARNSVPVVGLVGTDARQFGFTGANSGSGMLTPGQLRSLLTTQAAPRFTPEQIKEIALIAREQRNAAAVAEREAEAAERAAAAATATVATPGTPAVESPRTSSGPSWALPEVPDNPEALTRLSTHDDPKIREAVAAHDNTPANVLQRLTESTETAAVRARAARHPNLPINRIVTLASDRLITVRAGAARNPSMPLDYLTTLSNDPADSVRGAVARNPSTPPPMYAALATERIFKVRAHAARRKNIPADVEGVLSRDVSAQVRSALAKNRTTSITALRRLSRDSEQSVRTNAVKNPNFPASMLRGKVARDPAPGVRAAAAGNRNTPLGTLTRLSADPDAWVRRNVAWNERTPAILLLALSNDEDPAVRAAARRNSERAA